MLAHTTNPLGILMLNLLMVKGTEWQMCRKRLVMVMKNSAYHCPHDLADNKVNAIYKVYKIRKYDNTGLEHNYLFNHMDISNFPTSYYNLCPKDKWNVVCEVYDKTSGKSSLWVNHGKICDFAYCLSLKSSTLNLFNRVVHFNDASSFNRYIGSISLFHLVSSLLE